MNQQSLSQMDQQNSNLPENCCQNQQQLQIQAHDNHNSVQQIDVKKLVYQKAKQFWMQRMVKAKDKNSSIAQFSKDQNQIRNIIRIGLEVQQYLSEPTDFYNLYVANIEEAEISFKRCKNFVRKAKLMLRIFLDKNQDAKSHFWFPLNWVKLRLPSYPHIIKNPICIKQIQNKLYKNVYQNFEQFLSDMDKLFNDSLLFNFENQEMTEMTTKLRYNWTVIKYEVLQLKNFSIQSFINPDEELVPEMMDIDEEINNLREKVTIDKNMTEYIDYDPDYINANAMSSLSKQVNNSSFQQEKRKNSQIKKQQLSNSKAKNRRSFESCQESSRTIAKERILQLKKDISRCIAAQMSQKDIQKRRLLKYIHQKRQQNPEFLGQQNQINLQLLEYEEFVELEKLVAKFISEN